MFSESITFFPHFIFAAEIWLIFCIEFYILKFSYSLISWRAVLLQISLGKKCHHSKICDQKTYFHLPSSEMTWNVNRACPLYNSVECPAFSVVLFGSKFARSIGARLVQPLEGKSTAVRFPLFLCSSRTCSLCLVEITVSIENRSHGFRVFFCHLSRVPGWPSSVSASICNISILVETNRNTWEKCPFPYRLFQNQQL